MDAASAFSELTIGSAVVLVARLHIAPLKSLAAKEGEGFRPQARDGPLIRHCTTLPRPQYSYAHICKFMQKCVNLLHNCFHSIWRFARTHEKIPIKFTTEILDLQISLIVCDQR